MVKKIKIKSKSRWKVLEQDMKYWTIGLYCPENKTKDEIKFLEKHDCKEAFLLLDGDITLIVKDNSKKPAREIKLKKNEMVIVDNYHNAYSKNGGMALVIERGKVKTKFIDF